MPVVKNQGGYMETFWSYSALNKLIPSFPKIVTRKVLPMRSVYCTPTSPVMGHRMGRLWRAAAHWISHSIK